MGGGVRDLLLGIQPKDFDIATDATPDEIKSLFRNARIIGRRFRIVHIQFGREIIEVSTFRDRPEESVVMESGKMGRKGKQLDSAQSRTGMILRDNVYGNIEADVNRRDFTVNALYYTVQNFEIHDYFQGMEDIKTRTLRMIGDPVQRYREDPVRILRALRLAAKLDFTLAADTAAPITEYAYMLESIPAARLFDEFMKMFFSGSAMATFHKLLEYEVFGILFPATAPFLDKEGKAFRLMESAFASTDKRVQEGKRVTPSFLLAAVLWPPVEAVFNQLVASGMPAMPAMHDASQQIIREQAERISIPKRFSLPMREIWEYQLRLPQRQGKRAESLLSHKRFRAAYDFLLLREESGEELEGLGRWWTEFQEADPGTREQMVAAQGKNRRLSKQRKRKVKSSPRQRNRISKIH